MGHVELLEEEPLNQASIQYVNALKKSTVQLESYITTLETVSLDNETVRCQKQPVSVQKFIDTVSTHGKSLANLKEVRMDVLVDYPIPDYYDFDEQLIYRAIQNVIDNAIRYTKPKETITIRVRTTNDKISFSVEDCGPGFSQKALVSATQQFYMDDKGRNDKKHYGLGLYTVDQIIAKHRGNLYIQNSVETGGAVVTLIF